MKFGDLTSIAHNIATSVSDGVSVLFGAYELDIHGEAAASPGGRIAVDFLTGLVIEGEASGELKAVLAKSPQVLAQLAQRQGALPSDYSVLTASYGVDQVHGPHFTVTVQDHKGHRSTEKYTGVSGRRLRRGHKAATGA